MDTSNRDALTSLELTRFLAIAFGGGFVFQCIGVWTGVGEGQSNLWLLLSMWTPALATLCSGKTVRRLAWQRVKTLGLRFLPLSLLLGWAPVLLRSLLLMAFGAGEWNETKFPRAADGSGLSGVKGLAMALGVEAQSYATFGVNLLLTLALAGALVGVIGAFGEELGWRGVLQPELERRFGPIRGTILVGLIWGYWHLPANLAGYNDAANPWLTAWVVFPLMVIASSFVRAWLVRVSKSVWPATLSHGANNTIESGFVIVPTSAGYGTIAGLAGRLMLATFFAWLLRRATQRDAVIPAKPSVAA